MTTRTDDYLEVRGLRVAFGDFVAVDGVDLTLLQGQVHFLVGPNGAGKTTIIDALTGLAPGEGVANHAGDSLLGKPSHRIAQLGVGRTFQTATVFEELSVLQNLDIAGVRHRSRWSQWRARGSAPDAVVEAAETVGLTHLLDRPAGVLSHGQKQWLEIGMLLVQDASVMLLDEPVAGMSAEERDATGELLHHVGRKRTIVVVEHDMEFVRRYADVVTVLHAGRVLASGSMDEIRANDEVQRVYLGHSTEGAA